MSNSHYRDLAAWQKARTLAITIYTITRAFPRSEMFGLTQQMRRAALSVPCNIAEGYGRRTRSELVNFLGVARGSLFELETQIIIATDLEYLTREVSDGVLEQTLEVTRIVNGLIRRHSG